MTCFVTLCCCFVLVEMEVKISIKLRNISYLNILYKICFNILLEIWRHKCFLSPGPHLGVCDQEGEHLGDMGHDALQQGQRHRQEQRPGANLNIILVNYLHLYVWVIYFLCHWHNLKHTSTGDMSHNNYQTYSFIFIDERWNLIYFEWR